MTDTALITDETANSGFAWNAPVYDTSKVYIYLTFDDGPQHGTMGVYHICRQLGVKATFFMVGQHAIDKKMAQIVDTIRYSYPQILLANHSYTHAGNHYQYFYHHPDYALSDFLKAQKSLEVPYKIIRLPGNSAWVRDSGEVRASKIVKPVSLLLDSLGYNVIGWDLEWNFNHKDARPVQHVSSMLKMMNTAAERKESHSRNHIVLLAHDRMFRQPQDADSLRLFISELQKNPHYVFETIDNYPRLKRPQYEGN
ncbi:polysaccharide deacetylase family protein [Filimonas lacunae]|nr:polysaccharide deacetylase family protein [Filimonas lacunae]